MKYTSFRDSKNVDERFDESKRILTKYPDRIPIILEKYNDKQSPDLDRYKYLVQKDNTLAVLLYHIRSRTKIDPSQAIFLFSKGNMYSPSTMLAEIYNIDKDKDNFLYLTYSTENTFG